MIGIITFHAAYNFGSSLQAYATQKILKSLGFDNEIINYRLPNQIHYYGDLISFRFGRKDIIRRISCLSEIKERKLRANRYEDFIRSKLVTGSKQFHTYEEVKAANLSYDMLLAGSDQIWNRHCTAEFKTEPKESILPYFLDFENSECVKRISFSSSLGFMTKEEVKEFLPQLRRFQHLALREKDGAEMIGNLLNVEAANTIDPTLLFDRNQWISDFEADFEQTAGNYILIYSLEKSIKKLRRIQETVKKFAKGQRVICLSPFLSTHMSGIEMRNDAGPIQFLALLNGADCMVTDSFHGTAFSLNLGIPFYTLNTGKDERKKLLLERVGLEGQLLDSIDMLLTKPLPEVDFENAWEKLAAIRKESVDYLKHALMN